MLEALLAQSEGKTFELKESARSLDGIVRAVIAFANTAGGTLIIGVKDGSREIVGLTNVLQEEERIASALADTIAPLLRPDIEIQTYREKELLIIRIPHTAGPFYLKSAGPEKGVYIRFGSTNRVADDETLNNLRLFAKNLTFDELPILEDKLDKELIKKTFEQVNKRPTENTYEQLGLVTRRTGAPCPTNGGILLFGENRLKCFPDSIIRCARFAGTNKAYIIDQLDVDAPFYEAINLIIEFIERNIRKGAKIGRIHREDIFEYPAFAIREAVTNAILHTDYSLKGCQIRIAIFDDRIEITNPGALPYGLTMEKALAGSSKVRNRVIGRVFKELKLIEQWGSGLQRILEACKRQGLKTPLVEEHNNQFQLTLYSTKVEEVSLKTWGKLLLKRLEDDETISTKEAAKLWKVSTRTARLRLKELQEDGFIVRIGTSENDPNVAYIATRKSG